MSAVQPATRGTDVLVAMDKFRGTARALELVEHVAQVVRARGAHADPQAMSDGGEGFVDAFHGETRHVEVTGPLGEPVTARIRLHDAREGRRAVIEVADVVGRDRLRSPTSEQALAASSAGVGQLLLAAQELPVDSILVGCGGSATSDAGLGCYEVLTRAGELRVPVVAATDVTSVFARALDFAAQKGVADRDRALLAPRFAAARRRYLDECGLDVASLARTGAAGGIAGALAALGAELAGGFDVVAAECDLARRVRAASLVVTGEGRFDRTSLAGKVVVGVASLVLAPTELLIVCGSVDDAAAREFALGRPGARFVSLTQRFGARRARRHTLACVGEVVDEAITAP